MVAVGRKYGQLTQYAQHSEFCLFVEGIEDLLKKVKNRHYGLLVLKSKQNLIFWLPKEMLLIFQKTKSHSKVL